MTYNDYIIDTHMIKSVMKFLSNDTFSVDMIILEPVYPPFNDEMIETVRERMADAGNMLLARTSNRDAKK